MDFKIEISCQKCKCSFELCPTDFKDRATMECPNCGQAFPAKAYSHLKSGVVELGKVQEYVCENEENPYSENLFLARVKSYGTLHSLFDRDEN